MMTRIDETNLTVSDKNTYLQQRDEMAVAIKAIEILENITRSIRQAGGGGDIEGLADLTVKELAIIAARNSINIESKYTGEPSAWAARQEILIREKECCPRTEEDDQSIPF